MASATTQASTAQQVLWLEQALAEEAPRVCPPLDGDSTADVCIVGGGYTGLWTALELRRRAPELAVTLLEASECGFGPSGRNGGWAVGWHDKLDLLIEEFGGSAGLWLAARARQAVVDLEERTGELGIECGYSRDGALYAASALAQEGAWTAAVDACRRHGEAERFRELAPGEARNRTGIDLLGGGAEQTDTATVHPGRLVRGLRRAAAERGVRIAEHSEVRVIERSRPARVRTGNGSVTADHVVLATGAWAARVRELRRAIVPFASHVVATAPLPPDSAARSWQDRVAVSDMTELVHYAQLTEDRRIVFGRGGGAIGALGRVGARHFRDRRWREIVAADFRAWFPALRNVSITHAWGGPIDHTPALFPFVGSLGDHANIHYGLGYTGDGVAQSTFVASILAARVLGRDTEDAGCPLVGGPRAYLPPEPARSVPGRIVREAVLRAEAREAAGKPVPWTAGTLRSLSHFQMPRRLEPRLGARARGRETDRGRSR